MAIALVQSAAIGSASSGTSQQTSAFGANPTVGNYIVAWAWGWNTTSPHTAGHFAASDTGSNSYTQAAFQAINGDLWCALFYTKVATSGATFKLTLTASGESTGSIMVAGAEFSGVAGTSPADGAAVGTTGTTGVPAPGSLSFTAGDLVCGVFSSGQTTYTTFGYATPSGFTRAAFQDNGSTFQVGEGIYAIAPSSPTNPAWKTGTVSWGASQFALKAAAGASFAPTPYPRYGRQAVHRAGSY